MCTSILLLPPFVLLNCDETTRVVNILHDCVCATFEKGVGLHVHDNQTSFYRAPYIYLRLSRKMGVEVEEASVLHLIRDYLKEAGLCESLYALEVETGISPFAGRAAARRLALDGKWRELENALLQSEEGERGGEEGEKEDTLLQRARFVLVKQQYLEALARLDATAPHREPSEAELEQMLEYLEKLKQLAPSQEEYLALEALSAPDSSLHDHYSRWNLHSSRVECFSALMDWLRKWYLGAAGEERHSKHTKTTPHGSASQLVLLVAKGKLYEECEEICRQRCRGGEEASDSNEEAGSILDVSGWLQSQPEGMFQSAPSPVWIVTSPHNHPFSSSCNGRRPPATRATGCKLPPSIAVKESVDGTTEASTEDRGPKEKRGQVQGLSPASCPGGTPTQGAEVEEQVREHMEQVKRTTERLLENVKNIPKAMEHSHSSPPLQFEDNFSDFPAWLLQTTPLVHSLQQEGRDSSTPKPSTCPPPSSPPSSPVPHVSAVGVGLPSTPARHEHPPHKRGGERREGRGEEEDFINSLSLSETAMKGVVHPLSFKQIDFQQETGRESQSIEWPTASLAGTVRDTQVHCAVAVWSSLFTCPLPLSLSLSVPAHPFPLAGGAVSCLLSNRRGGGSGCQLQDPATLLHFSSTGWNMEVSKCEEHCVADGSSCSSLLAPQQWQAAVHMG